MKHIFLKLPTLLRAAIVAVMASTCAFGANVVVENADAPNIGFNDPTPVSPVGGNPGTTVGQQRLLALQYAAGIWGARLNSGPTITIRATWESLTCTTNSAALASAGNSGGIFRDFAGAVPNTWYGNALANAIRNLDSNGPTHEINARFNLNIGNPGCLESAHWYYGLDTNHGSGGVNLVSVALHEFAHGLGFQTFTSSSTGAQAFDVPSIYDRFLLDNSTGKLWPQMIDAERQASAINTTHLVWNGSRVKEDVPGILKTPLLKVNTPAAIAGNYEIGTPEFGPALSTPGVTANVVQSSPIDGCSALTNGAQISGKIALIDRGSCNFTVKVKNAQNAGAVGVIIVNNASGVPPGMGGSDPTITIPSVSITDINGNAIKAQLASGVNASLLLDPSTPAGADSAGRIRMFSPSPVEGGSSVSHFDETPFPNQLMEPNISSDLTHNLTPPFDLTTSLFADLGWQLTALPNTAQLNASNFNVSEGAGSAQIVVTRTDTAGEATVDYATSDNAALNECNVTNNLGSSRCDYATTQGTLRFFPGETSKTIFIPLVDDGYAEGNETFTVTLTNATGTTLVTPSSATITIQDNEGSTGANPIDGVDFFIRQQYIDFLGREPDPAGLAGWRNVLNNCGTTVAPPCDRIEVSAGFFRSEEFQSRGYYIYRFFSAVGKIPVSEEFYPDFAKVSGFLTADQLEANKTAYVNEVMARADFQTRYGSTLNNPTAYVDALLQTVGLPNHPGRAGWINTLNANNTTQTRGQVLRQLVESGEVFNKYFNEAFVIMQYFGYLRRTADASYLNWIQTMNQTNGDYRIMINGFMNSAEYRRRFGP